MLEPDRPSPAPLSKAPARRETDPLDAVVLAPGAVEGFLLRQLLRRAADALYQSEELGPEVCEALAGYLLGVLARMDETEMQETEA